MSGTKLGGLKAAATNKRLHGDDFYARIGAKGGSRSTPTGGFGADRERAKAAGAKGGSISRRTDGIRWWNENKDTIYMLQSEGKNNKEIARVLNTSYSRLWNILNKYGGK